MEELVQYLAMQNPWWAGAEPDSGIPRRAYLDKVLDYLKNTREIVIIGGVRRSGKTTLMYQTICHLIEHESVNPRHILFLSCDNSTIRKLSDPLTTVLDAYQKLTGTTQDLWLFFDEVQDIPDFSRILKNLYDTGRYHIIISGSTSHILESQSGTHLTGRYLPVRVYPLSFREYLMFLGVILPDNEIDLLTKKYELIGHLNTYLRNGGFPAIVSIAQDDIRRDYLKAYYDSILYRDIIASHDVRNQSLMQELLGYVITNIAAPQTFRSLAQIFKTDPARIQDYLSYAEDGYLLYTATKFSFSYKKQLVAPRKMYLADNGLRSAAGFVFSQDTGRLVENLVCIELLRRGYTPKYWKETNEIDFVVQRSGEPLTLLNVCYTSDVPERELKGFAEFVMLHPDVAVRKILLTEDLSFQLDDEVTAVPLWRWLLKE
ncbi:MAG: ATP-binding protein [Methanocorpusculum sp.]|nr:ATP-binding protein [Methanocorpusculum sp.]